MRELKEYSAEAFEDLEKYLDRFIAMKEEDRERAEKYRMQRQALHAAEAEIEDGPDSADKPRQRGAVEVRRFVCATKVNLF